MGLRAISEHQLIPNSTFMVGDRESDMEFAKELGFRAVQLRSDLKNSPSSDYCTDTLDDAANWILSTVDGKDK